MSYTIKSHGPGFETMSETRPETGPDTGFEMLISDLKNKDRFRELKQVSKREGKVIQVDHTPYLNLSSNDYLGLATCESLVLEFYSRLGRETCINRFGPGSSSSRLLTGNFRLYTELEQALCRVYGAEAALVFNSGYHANIGIIPALAGKSDLIVSDSLNHASIVDGIRLSKARCMICGHNNMAELEKILKENRNQYNTVLIVTESVFSMDGDLADIQTLVRLKKEFNALLYIDEAHSIGVYGATGLGLCHELGLAGQVDVLLAPMGKALASHGAFVITRDIIKQVLVNRTRPLLYSTALPPVAMNWNLFMITRLNKFSGERKRLNATARGFRHQLKRLGIDYTGDSHIIPVITRENEIAIRLAALLREKGFLVFPIRPPTVPRHQSRVRISLTADITLEDLAALPGLIKTGLNKENR